MILTRIKKALLVASVGIGATLAAPTMALTSYQQCLDLVDQCHVGNNSACLQVFNDCWRYNIRP